MKFSHFLNCKLYKNYHYQLDISGASLYKWWFKCSYSNVEFILDPFLQFFILNYPVFLDPSLDIYFFIFTSTRVINKEFSSDFKQLNNTIV